MFYIFRRQRPEAVLRKPQGSLESPRRALGGQLDGNFRDRSLNNLPKPLRIRTFPGLPTIQPKRRVMGYDFACDTIPRRPPIYWRKPTIMPSMSTPVLPPPARPEKIIVMIQSQICEVKHKYIRYILIYSSKRL